MDVGRVLGPSEESSLWSLEVVPSLVSGQGVGVEVSEKLWLNNLVGNSLNFASAWPDIFKENCVSILVLSDWLSLKINVNGAGKSISDNKWWTG